MQINHDSQIKNELRTRELMQTYFNTEHNLNPEIQVWSDTEVKLANDVDLEPVAQALGCEIDTLAVSSELESLYARFSEEAASAIAAETRQDKEIQQDGMRKSYVHTWEGRDGWYYCFSGTSTDGLYSESEDVGPFESRESAMETALNDIGEVV